MAKKKKSSSVLVLNSKQEIVGNGDRAKLESRAKEVDAQIASGIDGVQESFIHMSKLLAEVAEKKLWLYLADPRPKKKGFKNIEDYATWRFGKMKHTKVYDLIAISTLTEGPNPLTTKQIKKLGPKKAAALARMEPEKRTPEIVAKASEATFVEVSAMVQASVDEGLPEDQRREATIVVSRTLAISVAEQIEKTEAIALWMHGIRDADRSITRVSKVWGCAMIAMREYYRDELAAAETYMMQRCHHCGIYRADSTHTDKSDSEYHEFVETPDAETIQAAASKHKAAKANGAEAQSATDKANGHTQADDFFPDYENEDQTRRRSHSRSARA